MNQLPTTFLSFISGGYYSSHCAQLAATPHATISPVFINSPDDTESGFIAPVNSLRSHCAAPPKNGDRNALGQQYSWGTWWDDTH